MVMTQDRRARLADEAAVSEQHVKLAKMLGNGQARGKISERAMYYRKPPKGNEAGWIVVNGTNPERQQGLFSKGCVPLQQYGFVDPQSVEHEDPSYRQWAQILRAPGGPEEFPVEQLIAFRWYDPEVCPVPGVRFPQLDGVAIQRVWCPECETVYFHKPNHLARHLRVMHDYDRAEIIAVGQELGISFAKEMTNGRRGVEEIVYDAGEAAHDDDEAPAPVVAFDEARPKARRKTVTDDDA